MFEIGQRISIYLAVTTLDIWLNWDLQDKGCNCWVWRGGGIAELLNGTAQFSKEGGQYWSYHGFGSRISVLGSIEAGCSALPGMNVIRQGCLGLLMIISNLFR